MVGRYSFKFYLHLTFHRATNREVGLLIKGLKDDLLLNKILVLIRTDPSGTSSQSGRVLLTFVDLFNNIVVCVWAHYEEACSGLLSRDLLVSHLVEVVVNHLSKIDKRVLLDLNGGIHIYFDSRGVHYTQVTDVILAILADNHKLRLPKLLVVWDLVMVSLTFANFKNALSAVN